MGFDAFAVVLTTNAPVYFSGQKIEGFVRAVVSSATACREITITMYGKGKVEWTEHRNKRTYTYTGKEEYGKQAIVLWRGNESDDRLPAGNHTFPFMFVIPSYVPSSFQSALGTVHYELKGSADRPWSFDETHKAYFNVHNIYDLNEDGQAREPLIIQKEDSVGCCSDGPISLDMSINRTGFVPGEIIKINGRIINNTNSTIQYAEAKITQCLHLHAETKSKEEKITVQRVYRPNIKAGREQVWNNVPLSVPAVAPTLFRFCNIIDIVYNLEFIAKIGSCKKLKANSKIIIGSVALQRNPSSNIQPHGMPLGDRMYQQNIMAASPSRPSAPMTYGGGYGDVPPPYSDPAPPSYEASKAFPVPYSLPEAKADADDEGGFAPNRCEKSGYNQY